MAGSVNKVILVGNLGADPEIRQHAEALASSTETSQSSILKFQDPPLDFVFDDAIIENVQAAWQRILPEADDFMVFGERNEDAQEEAEDEE